jgi:hypothetical protein
VFGSILGGTVQEEIETQKEVNEKMTSVLEQTLLKNVSLEVWLRSFHLLVFSFLG